MRNLENKLTNRIINYSKLIEYGFTKKEHQYLYINNLSNKQFKIVILISDEEKTSQIIDLENGEEYLMVDITDSTGKFVGKIKKEYEDILYDIIKKCTVANIHTNNKCGLSGELLSQKVYDYLTTIPKGKVVTYKQIGEYLGNKGLARAVGNILHKNTDGNKYPCYKVLNSKGQLAEAFVFGGKTIQKSRLEDDGIKVVNNKVDLKIYQWKEK